MNTVKDSMGEWYVTQPGKEKEILEKGHAEYFWKAVPWA